MYNLSVTKTLVPDKEEFTEAIANIVENMASDIQRMIEANPNKNLRVKIELWPIGK